MEPCGTPFVTSTDSDLVFPRIDPISRCVDFVYHRTSEQIFTKECLESRIFSCRGTSSSNIKVVNRVERIIVTERKRGGGVSPVDKLEVLMFADRHRREVNVDRCRED